MIKDYTYDSVMGETLIEGIPSEVKSDNRFLKLTKQGGSRDGKETPFDDGHHFSE